ncbi:Translocation protein S66 [Binucleata daphniae]
MDFIKFCELKNEIIAAVVLQKALLKAAVTLKKRTKELQSEKAILNVLHRDRIISHETWSMIKNSEEDIDYETKEITAEAQELRDGWQDKIFEEASAIANKSNKEDKTKDLKGADDVLFTRKREVLSKDLYKRLEENRNL